MRARACKVATIATLKYHFQIIRLIFLLEGIDRLRLKAATLKGKDEVEEAPAAELGSSAAAAVERPGDSAVAEASAADKGKAGSSGDKGEVGAEKVEAATPVVSEGDSAKAAVALETASSTAASQTGEAASEQASGKNEDAPPFISVHELLKKRRRAKDRVCYFFHEDVATFEVAASHLARPMRARMAHEIVDAWGVYASYLDPIRPRLATRTDIGQFHADPYVATLQTADDFLEMWPHDVAQEAARAYLGSDASVLAMICGTEGRAAL